MRERQKMHDPEEEGGEAKIIGACERCHAVIIEGEPKLVVGVKQADRDAFGSSSPIYHCAKCACGK